MIPLAVFGDPIHHSLSPVIHSMFAVQTGQTVNYRPILAPPDSFPQQFKAFFNSGGHGANITLPHKTAALELVDRLSKRAAVAGAINTVTRREDQLWGDNTDGEGLIEDLRRLGAPLSGAKVLIIGAGGAVRGILQPLFEAGVKEIFISNRTESKAQALIERFVPQPVQVAQAEQSVEAGLVINASAAGHGGTFPPLPQHWLIARPFCYDLSYGGAAQPFIRYAESSGLTVHDGLGMLVGQAAASFHIWTGHKPEVPPVLAKLRRSA